MTRSPSNVAVHTKQIDDEWEVWFTVGVQTFTIGRVFETEEEADWYLDQFKIALKNLGITV